MLDQEINRLNNIITNHLGSIDQLNQKNNQLYDQNRSLRIRVFELQNIIKGDPIHKVLLSISQMKKQKQQYEKTMGNSKLQRTINDKRPFCDQYNQVVLKNYQHCKRQIQIKNKQIQDQAVSTTKQDQKLVYLQHQKMQWSQKINQKQNFFQRQVKKYQNANNAAQNYKQKFQKMRKDYYQQQKYFSQQRANFQSKISMLQQNFVARVKNLRKHRNKSTENIFEQNQDLKILSSKIIQYQGIMDKMSQQLRQRNQQLAKYISVDLASEKTTLGLEDSCLKNTNHNLKSLLSQKSRFIKNILNRLKNIEQLNQKQQKQNKKLQKEVSQMKDLKQHTNKLQKDVQKLTLDNRLIQQKLHTAENRQKKQLDNMYLILLENECYHKFMQYQYGAKSYMKQIEQARNKMQQDMEQRGKNQKWVSIEELIKMNKKLMQKI